MTCARRMDGRGSWTRRPLIRRAIEAGINFFDTADIYGAVAAIAANRGVPMAEVAMAWLLARPGVTAPIVGASKSQHLDDAIAALSLALDEDEIQCLEAGYVPLPVPLKSVSRPQ
jgi:1-deoxyxylulose-5-phosphate synthase